MCNLSECVCGGFAGLLCNAGSIRLPARVRPDLLSLVFIFKMLCGSSLGGEGSPSSRLLITTLCSVASSRPKAGFKVGSLQDGPSPLAFDQNSAGWQSHTSLPLLVLAGRVKFLDSKSKAACPLLLVWLAGASQECVPAGSCALNSEVQTDFHNRA